MTAQEQTDDSHDVTRDVPGGADVEEAVANEAAADAEVRTILLTCNQCSQNVRMEMHK